jgi:hypothetical protein
MAQATNMKLTILKDVANADLTFEYDIVWSDFDKATNLLYTEVWGVKEDDTSQDGDDGPAGDDPISLGLMPLLQVSANGAASTHRTFNKTIAYASLGKDNGLPSPDDDEEIRAFVTLTPQLPLASTRESSVVPNINA